MDITFEEIKMVVMPQTRSEKAHAMMVACIQYNTILYTCTVYLPYICAHISIFNICDVVYMKMN